MTMLQGLLMGGQYKSNGDSHALPFENAWKSEYVNLATRLYVAANTQHHHVFAHPRADCPCLAGQSGLDRGRDAGIPRDPIRLYQ